MALDPEQAVQAWVTMALDTSLIGYARFEAARELSALDATRAADLLTEIAADLTLDGTTRMSAARQSGWLDDPRAADLLAVIAADSLLQGDDRLMAAEALADLGDTRVAALLALIAAPPSAELATDAATSSAFPCTSAGTRIIAAGQLSALGDDRGTDLLTAFITDQTLAVGDRVAAAERLSQAGDGRTGDMLAELAADFGPSPERFYVARLLGNLGDERFAKLPAEGISGFPDPNDV